jgi:hypothetical protein
MSENLIRAMGDPQDVDVPKRILRAAPIATNRLATDGWLVIPDGISLAHYAANSVVLARHGMGGQDARSPVIGRSVALMRTATGLESSTQFADTELGREYAYLYGVNDAHEVYMRAWSFRADILERTTWSFGQAKRYVGADWDEDMAALIRKDKTAVSVATRTMMAEYSAVAIGADRGALQRAHDDKGIRLAGELLSDIDLRTATELLGQVRREQDLDKQRLDKLERDIQALRGEGASAAARGYSEAIARELDALLALARRRQATARQPQ